MKETISVIICILLGIVFVIGWNKDEKRDIDYGMATISPSSLFKGDAKRLQPHLRMYSGCVDVNYKGNKKSIIAKWEIWEKGKVASPKGSLSIPINKGYNGEVSISLKDSYNKSKMELVSAIYDQDGYSTFAQEVDKFDSINGNSIKNLNELIKINDDKEVVVWAFISGKYKAEETLEKTAKSADRALVLKIKFE